MKFLKALSVLSLLSLVGFIGCAVDKVDVVDLNKVLDAVVAVLEDTSANPDAGNATVNVAGGGEQQNAQVKAVDPTKQDPEKEKAFLTKLAAKMNEMKVMDAKVGVSLTQGGEIVGFQDPNGNNVQEFEETKEFTVTIDLENSRLVAADNNGHYRPSGFRPGGFMTGYFLGSMLGRQNSFYSSGSGIRPNFNNTPMSPQNYHSSAVSSARSARASSARATSGAKGFSIGK